MAKHFLAILTFCVIKFKVHIGGKNMATLMFNKLIWKIGTFNPQSSCSDYKYIKTCNQQFILR